MMAYRATYTIEEVEARTYEFQASSWTEAETMAAVYYADHVDPHGFFTLVSTKVEPII